MTIERWKPIDGWPKYEVSDHGRIKRVAGGKGAKPGTILKGSVSKNGYRTVFLYDGSGGAKCHYVHRLVLEAFCGTTDGQQCNHLDTDRLNNRIDNLEWATAAENNLHARTINPPRYATGSRIHTTKLCPADVVEIRKRLRRGESRRSIGRWFGVNHKAISAIANGRTWAWV